MRAITEQTYVDEVDMDEEGIAEMFMEDSVLADVASMFTVKSTNYNSLRIMLKIIL